jgi:hypothetical protein
MSPKLVNTTSGRRAINALSMISKGRDADRATRAVDHADVLGQQFVDALADQGVGLAAADFHQRPGTGRGGVDLGQESPGESGVAVLAEVLSRPDPPLSSPVWSASGDCSHGGTRKVSSLGRRCPGSWWLVSGLQSGSVPGLACVLGGAGRVVRGEGDA